jgi:hypothetical protein
MIAMSPTIACAAGSRSNGSPAEKPPKAVPPVICLPSNSTLPFMLGRPPPCRPPCTHHTLHTREAPFEPSRKGDALQGEEFNATRSEATAHFTTYDVTVSLTMKFRDRHEAFARRSACARISGCNRINRFSDSVVTTSNLSNYYDVIMSNTRSIPRPTVVFAGCRMQKQHLPKTWQRADSSGYFSGVSAFLAESPRGVKRFIPLYRIKP